MDAINKKTITKEQRDLIERFKVAYNKIEHHFQEKLGKDKNTSFTYLVKLYAEKYPRWRERDFLMMISDLRNVVVHQREWSYEYLSVPLPFIVEDLERIRDQLISPELVFPKFDNNVTCFQTDDVLSKVLVEIHKKSFSQFPIYDKNSFQNLLTENGITRWLAKHSMQEETILELKEIKVSDMLDLEEKRTNFQFIPRYATMLDAENYFIQNTLLEALLITHSGKLSEKLIGILTRWDILRI